MAAAIRISRGTSCGALRRAAKRLSGSVISTLVMALDIIILGLSHPRRSELRDSCEHRARLIVRAGEEAAAQEEGSRDFAAGEDEGFFEEAHPLVFAARVMRVEPGSE